MWEYRVEKTPNVWAVLSKEYLDRLNNLGEQGWELITVHENNLYFKRPKKIPPVP
jgi:hypothetical protein